MILMCQCVQIILDDNKHINGGRNLQHLIVFLVDCEYVGLFPLGMNAWCIRFLSVPTPSGNNRIMDKTQPMVEAFWKALNAQVPEHLHRNLIVAIQPGLLILSTFFEGGTVNTTAMAQFVQRHDLFREALRSLI